MPEAGSRLGVRTGGAHAERCWKRKRIKKTKDDAEEKEWAKVCRLNEQRKQSRAALKKKNERNAAQKRKQEAGDITQDNSSSNNNNIDNTQKKSELKKRTVHKKKVDDKSTRMWWSNNNAASSDSNLDAVASRNNTNANTYVTSEHDRNAADIDGAVTSVEQRRLEKKRRKKLKAKNKKQRAIARDGKNER
eukprot:TRINITY_DN2513_c0_g1_i1.p1 TRINITY_DN2513_c0_g1~~TRINITY_DN2513_c0_g1_i1.p1  ORF type:complete len:191 (+),score=53.11 TRINITY_DN2513_c0_g1_i1:56-628(+)